MTARDQLADVIVQVLDCDRMWPDAQETALAVADAVIGMVLPLEWVQQTYKSPDQIGHHASSYSIYESTKNGACAVSSGAPYFFGPVHTSDIEAAKAAANRHHRAQILAALGITQETAE